MEEQIVGSLDYTEKLDTIIELLNNIFELLINIGASINLIVWIIGVLIASYIAIWLWKVCFRSILRSHFKLPM